MKKVFIILVVSVLCLCACVMDCIDYIQIVNNSDYGQVVCLSCSDSIGYGNDTLSLNLYFKQYKYNIIEVDDYIHKDSTQRYKITIYKERLASSCKDKHIRFFFITDTVFFNNAWDTIIKYKKYDKLVFSQKDLEKNNYTITYK